MRPCGGTGRSSVRGLLSPVALRPGCWSGLSEAADGEIAISTIGRFPQMEQTMTIDGIAFTELRPSLYGEGGLFEDIRLRDARRLFSRIVRRKSRGGFMVRYVPTDEVTALRLSIAAGDFALPWSPLAA